MRRALALMVAAIGLTGCLSFQRGPLAGAPASARFVEVDGHRIRVLDEGEGPAVVLVHGFNSSLEVWREVVPELRRRHRVIALDLKGFGFSDRPPGDYSPAAQAAVVSAVMDALGVERAALVAHSWGATVALSLARAHPERVTHLALYSAWVYDEQLTTFIRWSQAGGVGEVLVWLFYEERAAERLELGFFDPARITHAMVEDAEAAAERDGAAAVALAVVRGQTFAQLEPGYAEVTTPTLILWGRDDRIATVGNGERLRAQLPHARLEVFPRCGHYPMLEAPASTRRLAGFLSPGDNR